MPIGIVSDSDFESELSKVTPTSNGHVPKKEGTIIVPSPLGKPKGRTDVPESIRNIIAEERIEGTPNKELQQLFGLKHATISAYENGATSGDYSKPNQDLNNHVRKVRNRISRRARQKLTLALDEMTVDKFQEAPLPVLSRVASDMAGIIERMEPKVEESKNNVQFMIYAPRIEKEEHYSVIDVEN